MDSFKAGPYLLLGLFRTKHRVTQLKISQTKKTIYNRTLRLYL
ncbi:hypothetical protein DK880_00146 [Candidatus Cardinium hertigii]|uniref:Uncharacterized protein n=1 Tax=Candidatus Cardinium hertigii TaxID=247481 RepID=A0A2Z3LB46_9BACT|nr:hypothetical protein DK880_00146 [Candidatus Cardinium hertigii]